MTLSPVDVLKGRLARGEISIAEYQQVFEHLTNGDSLGMSGSDRIERFSQKAATIKTASTRVLEGIFGPNSHDAPTDSAPLEINKRFVIYGSFFEHKGKRFAFEQIVSIGSNFDTQTINLVSSSSAVVTLVLADREKILLTGMSIVTAGKTNKLVKAAYRILCVNTFLNRYQRYENAIKNDHSVVLNADQLLPFGKVSLSEDGCLVKGRSRVNLRLSAKNNCLIMGTSWGSSVQGGVNPYEIVAGESGTSIFSNRIKVEVIFDRDVVFELVRRFAGIE